MSISLAVIVNPSLLFLFLPCRALVWVVSVSCWCLVFVLSVFCVLCRLTKHWSQSCVPKRPRWDLWKKVSFIFNKSECRVISKWQKLTILSQVSNEATLSWRTVAQMRHFVIRDVYIHYGSSVSSLCVSHLVSLPAVLLLLLYKDLPFNTVMIIQKEKDMGDTFSVFSSFAFFHILER